MNIFDQISKDIFGAMKAQDKIKLETLRNVKKEFLEAKTAPGSNGELSDDKALRIIQKLVKQGKDSAALYLKNNRKDLADEESAQVKVLESYLPQQLSEEEVTRIVKDIIGKVGASGMQDMGKVMGMATKTLIGKAEGSAIAAVVKKLLN